MRCDAEELNLHTFDAISQSSRKDEFYAVVRGACRTLGLTSLMLDLGFSVQAELRTNKTAAKRLASRRGAGQVRHIHCFALWLQQSIARRRSRIEKRAVSTLSTDVGTTMQKMWELLTRFGCRKCARRTDVALQNTRCCCNLNWLHRTKEVAHMLTYLHKYMTSWRFCIRLTFKVFSALSFMTT